MEGTARIWFTPKQKAELWQRWKRLILHQIRLLCVWSTRMAPRAYWKG